MSCGDRTAIGLHVSETGASGSGARDLGQGLGSAHTSCNTPGMVCPHAASHRFSMLPGAPSA